jgi:hypothetical protein
LGFLVNKLESIYSYYVTVVIVIISILCSSGKMFWCCSVSYQSKPLKKITIVKLMTGTIFSSVFFMIDIVVNVNGKSKKPWPFFKISIFVDNSGDAVPWGSGSVTLVLKRRKKSRFRRWLRQYETFFFIYYNYQKQYFNRLKLYSCETSWRLKGIVSRDGVSTEAFGV